MKKTAIIIPSRLNAQRLPNKPLKLIKNKEMILHVYEAAKKSGVTDVIVATPDQKIIDVVKNHGGKSVKTSISHQTGTDRIFEVFKNILNNGFEFIINLQGDMPNIDPSAIKDLIKHMEENKCDIGTLCSEIDAVSELEDQNIVKVILKDKIKPGQFSRAINFVRSKPINKHNVYHHVGIYAFTKGALMRYVSLKRSKLELERNLEQLRALENKMSINVGCINFLPLSVDTENDLLKIKKVMENEKK